MCILITCFSATERDEGNCAKCEVSISKNCMTGRKDIYYKPLIHFHSPYTYFGKTHIKKVFFLVVGPLRFYPPYTNGLGSIPLFFFIFFYKSVKRILTTFYCSPIFGLKKANMVFEPVNS